MSARRRTSTKHFAPESEDDDEFMDDGANAGSGDDYYEPGTSKSSSSRTKGGKARNEEGARDMDPEPEAEPEVDIEDTRFLPDGGASLKRGRSKKGSAKKSAKRRAVILSDEEDADVDVDVVMDEEDDDFEPEPKRGVAKGKGRGIVSSKASKGKGGKPTIEKDITFRDERKLAPPAASSTKQPQPSRAKRPHSKVDNDDDPGFDVVNEKATTPPPPPPKRPKLPTIKKNKPAPGSTNSTNPSTPLTRPSLTKTTTGLPQQTGPNGLPARKPAATANNADFDLRDANVYAQLFTKVCQVTLVLTRHICNPRCY